MRKPRSSKVFTSASTSTRHSKTKLATTTPPPNSKSGNSKRKRAQDDEGARSGKGDEGIDHGSDSEGNEWKVGHVSDDDDSDLDSDEAMGESDEERFADFAFRGSSSKGKGKSRNEGEQGLDEGGDEEEEEEEGGEDGEGYVDLSEMLDRPDSEDEDEDEDGAPANGGTRKNNKKAVPSDLREGDLSDSSIAGESASEDSDEEADQLLSEAESDSPPEDPAKLATLQDLISSLPTASRPTSKRVRIADPNESKTPNEYNLSLPSTQKLTVSDFLPTATDPWIKKSLKLISSDAPAKPGKSGVQGKLSAPLAKRQQDRLDRAAAYEKSKETLDRWADTVKHGREADHLQFPLPNAPNAPVPAPKRLPAITPESAPLTDLEATISGILKESNMASEKAIKESEELETNKLSMEEVQRRTAELRLARELLYREEAKAKRIKKIKSKAYHRIQKKERLKQQKAIEETLALERGGMEGEEELMERERKRAEERMTLRHKNSKWAKDMKNSGRTVWDEEAQDGVVEMAKRSEELRMRIAGKKVRGEDDTGSDSSSEEEAEDPFNENQEHAKNQLLRELEALEAEAEAENSANGGQLRSKLMSLKFMQNAEAAQKKANKAELEDLRKALDDDGKSGEASDSGDDSGAQKTGGRMTFTGGRKGKDNSQKKNRTAKPQPEGAGNTSASEDSDNPDEPEFLFTNNASVSIPKNPFSHPGVSRKQTKPPFLPPPEISKPAATRPTPGSKPEPKTTQSNPWLSQDTATSLTKPKPQLPTASKQSSKASKLTSKLAKGRKRALDAGNPDPDIEISMTPSLNLAPKAKTTTSNQADGNEGEEDDDEKAIALIPTKAKAKQQGTRPDQRELVKRAFAGDNVVKEFQEEKKRKIEDEADKTVDTRVPGWGSWTGTGLPKHLKKKGGKKDNKHLKTIKGISKEKRKDRKLAAVIINERRVKKVPPRPSPPPPGEGL